ncbi:unnamed protein product [Rhizoctonia solani]|uniref:Uncharacterized protein n=1 Tax=Rhizoctonia solani TaxID=456999 RepID=A0A8H3A148_9AGAM|nr:unnamed protein product [Rhizoctonia solani]
MLCYTVPASSMHWYPHSLSYALHRIAQSGERTFPPAFNAALEEAGGNVYDHECYFNDMYAGKHAPHQDPMFVYNGYLIAVANLLREIEGHLYSILLIAHSRCTSRVPLILTNDREWDKFLTDFAQVLKP